LRQVLAQILSMVKAENRTPILLNTPATQILRKDDIDFSLKVDALLMEEQDQVERKLASIETSDVNSLVPIVMTSSLSGSGIASLHAMLRTLPIRRDRAAPVLQPPEKNQVVFRTDEVFAIPPSKVYSNPTERDVTDNGVVLCGLIGSVAISLGDELMLGPFLMEAETSEALHARSLRRSSSHHSKSLGNSLPRSLSEHFSKSLQLNGRQIPDQEPDAEIKFVKVRVVSLRNLRLPVSSMHPGDTGTVGIQASDTDSVPATPLNKARKGMILAQLDKKVKGYRSFTAAFPYSDFSSSASPPLILGGHAIAYIHTIRAPVKVTAVALEDDDKSRLRQNGSVNAQAFPHDEVFSFEDDNGGQIDDLNRHVRSQSTTSLRITFKFVSTVEFLATDDPVLVVPNMTPSGPLTGPPSTSTIPGFSGFVGRVYEMHI